MILIIGGAYQGKLDYALSISNKKPTIFNCTSETVNIDFTKDIINYFHMFVFATTKNNGDAVTYINDNLDKLKNKIIISDDISCGVVPVDSTERLWRENAGRCLTFISKNADEVYRVFCGIEMQLKG